jgi:hypothetical protein
MWKSGDNLVEVSECIQKDINEIMEWSRKWRININADKTEYSIFSRLIDCVKFKRVFVVDL